MINQEEERQMPAPRKGRTRPTRELCLPRPGKAVGALAGLIRDLPKLRQKAGGLDLAGSPPQEVYSVMENAETTVGVLNMGIAAIGVLIAHSSPEIEDGTIHQQTIESLGWALSEMGELAGACTVLAARCRHAHPPPEVDRSPSWYRNAVLKMEAPQEPD